MVHWLVCTTQEAEKMIDTTGTSLGVRGGRVSASLVSREGKFRAVTWRAAHLPTNNYLRTPPPKSPNQPTP